MARMFIGGRSTRPEVDELMKIDLVAGSAVSYGRVSEAIGVSQTDLRFRTVTTVWRRRIFRERGLISTAEDRSFHFLTADEAQDHAHRSVRRIGRASGKLVREVGVIRVDDLTSEDRRKKHFLFAREAAALLEAAQNSARQLMLPRARTTENSIVRIAK